MTHYYQTEIPPDVLDFLVDDTEDPAIFSQDGILPSKEDQKIILSTACLQGRIVLFYNEAIAVIITRRNAYVGNFDTKVSSTASAREVIKGYKAFFEWAKKETFYNKLETRTPLEKFAKTMTKAVKGAKLEGVLEKSYMTKEGTMINEYLVGYVLREVGEPCPC